MLDTLKENNKLGLLANQLTHAKQDVDSGKKQALEQMLNTLLAGDPHKKGTGLEDMSKWLNIAR